MRRKTISNNYFLNQRQKHKISKEQFMKTEAIFNGVRNGFIFVYGFQNKVAQ